MLDLASGTGDLCVELGRRGYRPRVRRPVVRHAAPPTAAASPRVQADVLRLPVAAGSSTASTCGFALRNLVDLGAVLRRAGPGACAPAAASPCSRWPPRPTRCCAAGHAVYFGKVVPLVGGLLSDPAAYRYLPRSVAYLPPPEEMLARLAAAGFADVDRRLLSGGIAQLMTATRAMKAVTRRLERPIDLVGFAGGDGYLFVPRRRGPGRPGRGGARGRAPTRRRSWPPSPSTTTVERPGTGPVAFGALPFLPGRRRRARRARRRRARATPTARPG